MVPRPAVNAVRTSVASAAADTLLLAANRGRLGAIIYNDATTILRVGLGTAAVSATDFTVEVAIEGTLRLDEQTNPYNGMIRGFWDGAPTGSARITELT